MNVAQPARSIVKWLCQKLHKCWKIFQTIINPLKSCATQMDLKMAMSITTVVVSVLI